LWRRPRLKLGCGAKERIKYLNHVISSHAYYFDIVDGKELKFTEER
jgi:hypothetical protein